MKVSTVEGARNIATVSDLLDRAHIEGVVAKWYVVEVNCDVCAVKHYGSIARGIPECLT